MQQNSWNSVAGIVKYYGDAQDDFQPYAGPGNWNDPDMVRDCKCVLFGSSACTLVACVPSMVE